MWSVLLSYYLQNSFHICLCLLHLIIMSKQLKVPGSNFISFIWHKFTRSFTAVFSLCFNGHFPGTPGLAGTRMETPFIGVKGDGGGGNNLHFKTCKAPVKMSPSTNPNTHSFYRPDALPVAQPTVSKRWREHHCRFLIVIIIALRTKLSGTVYYNWSCMFVCGSVTTITWNCASIFTKLGLYVKVVTISSWLNFGRPAPPGRGSVVGWKFWLRLTTDSVCVSWVLFHFVNVTVVLLCTHKNVSKS